MATFEQEQESRNNLTKALEDLASTDAKTLERTAELGATFSFQDISNSIERILDLFGQLNNIPLEGISFNLLNKLLEKANDALRKFGNYLVDVPCESRI